VKKTVVRAPCRIDLAGGTVDLWPLYLHLGGLELVHMAVDVQAAVEVDFEKSRKGLQVEIESLDLERSIKFASLDALHESLSHSTDRNPLRWVARVTHHKLEQTGFQGRVRVRTRSDAPPGSGLGGSSVLGIALARAFEKSFAAPAKRSPAWDLQQEIRDLEAAEIEHPAGDQDYVPALFGGLLVFKLGPRRREVERLSKKTAEAVGDSSALLYTGKPHHSGLNNWQIFRAFHERDARVTKSLGAIRDLSGQLAAKLRSDGERAVRNFLPDLLNEEWNERLRLSPAVNAPVLDEAWSFARSTGAIARKACGAGGGGCLLVIFKSPEAKAAALTKTLPHASWRWLSTQPAYVK
jgi:D-glycero-alpha-D-manno-heptose-7-phosphate kinase